MKKGLQEGHEFRGAWHARVLCTHHVAPAMMQPTLRTYLCSHSLKTLRHEAACDAALFHSRTFKSAFLIPSIIAICDCMAAFLHCDWRQLGIQLLFSATKLKFPEFSQSGLLATTGFLKRSNVAIQQSWPTGERT